MVVDWWILRETLLSHPFPGGCEVSDFASNIWALWLYSTNAGDKCIVTKYSATLNLDGVITSFSTNYSLLISLCNADVNNSVYLV